MAGTLDQELVDAFVNDTIGAAGEQQLARQVADVLPHHWLAPSPVREQLSRLLDKVGGEPAVLQWLDRHPGEPRLVARLFGLIETLDRFGGEAAVVTALAEYRAHTPYPPGLEGFIVTDTNPSTLADLGAKIELLMGGDPDEAVRLAITTMDTLIPVTQRAAELDPHMKEFGDILEHHRRAILAAASPE